MLVNKQGMVSKYKELNREHKKKVQENAELTAELARLRQGSGLGSRHASPNDHHRSTSQVDA